MKLIVCSILSFALGVVIALLLMFVNCEEKVNITLTGTSYHIEGCSAIYNRSAPIKLSDAIYLGFKPCNVCRP